MSPGPNVVPVGGGMRGGELVMNPSSCAKLVCTLDKRLINMPNRNMLCLTRFWVRSIMNSNYNLRKIGLYIEAY
jgi:hypothetical protein